MNTIILATHNRNKVAEFQRMLPDYQVSCMSDLGINDEIPETGTTFTENALCKAEALLKLLNQRRRDVYIIVADDSGLCVNTLGGKPGVYTARYCGEDTPYSDKRAALRKELEGASDRSASYQCSVVAFLPGHQRPLISQGIVQGEITREERGENGFAFDSIFLSAELNKTFGEATNEEKDSVSHRARAIRDLSAKLAAAGYGGRDDEPVLADIHNDQPAIAI